MVTGGINRKIYDVVINAPGSYHDSAIWTMSRSKGWLETRFPRRFVLGDSAYPQSEVMMTPYPEDQIQNDDNKCLFNVRHSSARCEMTECIYGMLKRRFPILVWMRNKLQNAIKIIMCCVILHNIAIEWNEPLPEDEDGPEDIGGEVEVPAYNEFRIIDERKTMTNHVWFELIFVSCGMNGENFVLQKGIGTCWKHIQNYVGRHKTNTRRLLSI